ncbi:MAG: vitamin B12 dependent-methionine synthase activation domain-containing protein [Atribacterota bacterium]|nr:vitamin B12 dependent-methionine synthase activation domain-containing protein [Atribacterota bacterium]
MKITKSIKLKIDEEEVLRYQGCHNDKLKKINNAIMKITREEIERGHHLFEPKGISSPVKIMQISFSSGIVDLINGFSLNFSPSIMNLLKGVSYLVLGVATIGSSLENKVFELFSQGEYPKAIALDAVGTVSVRFLSNYMRSLVCQEAKEQNLQTTKYFSPGSGDWDISQQKNIFQIIPVDKIGVKLTESYMMVPQKSLSWVMGIGKNITISSKNDHSCQICQAANCQFRIIF